MKSRSLPQRPKSASALFLGTKAVPEVLWVWLEKCYFSTEAPGRTKGRRGAGGLSMAKTGTILKKGKKLAAAKSLMTTVTLRKS